MSICLQMPQLHVSSSHVRFLLLCHGDSCCKHCKNVQVPLALFQLSCNRKCSQVRGCTPSAGAPAARSSSKVPSLYVVSRMMHASASGRLVLQKNRVSLRRTRVWSTRNQKRSRMNQHFGITLTCIVTRASGVKGVFSRDVFHHGSW